MQVSSRLAVEECKAALMVIQLLLPELSAPHHPSDQLGH